MRNFYLVSSGPDNWETGKDFANLRDANFEAKSVGGYVTEVNGKGEKVSQWNHVALREDKVPAL